MAAVIKEDQHTGAGGLESETTLLDSALNRTFQIALDISGLASGDSFRVRQYRKVRSAGSYVLHRDTIVGKTSGGVYFVQNYGETPTALAMPCMVSVPDASPYGMKFTMNQLAGAAANVQYSIETL